MSLRTSSDIKILTNTSFPTIHFPKPKRRVDPSVIYISKHNTFICKDKRRSVDVYSEEEIEKDFLNMRMRNIQEEIESILSNRVDIDDMNQVERACHPFYKNCSLLNEE